MKISRGTRGAISIFLVIILVPCIAVCSVFVDLARMQMGRGVAYSAADLALNSLMANYDTELSDYYGVMGACQGIDTYYPVADQYFLRMLNSRDMEMDELKTTWDKVNYDIEYGGVVLTDKKQVSDLLLIENKTEGSMVTAVEDGALSNATIMQDQIVEFMKYRAPVVIVTDLLDRLEKQPGMDLILDSDENNPLVEDKRAFYDAEGELLKAAYNTYRAIYKYEKKADDLKVDNEQIKTYRDTLNDYRKAYEGIHTSIIKNLHNCENRMEYKRHTKSLTSYEYSITDTDIHSEKVIPTTPTPVPLPPEATEVPEAEVTEAPPSPTPIYYIDATKLNSAVNELNSARGEFLKNKDKIVAAGKPYLETMPGSGENDAYVIQWWAQCIRSINEIDNEEAKAKTLLFSNSSDKLVKAYAKVLAMSKCTRRTVSDSEWQAMEKALNDTRSVHGIYLVSYEQGIADGKMDMNDPYAKLMRKLEEVSAAHANYEVKMTNNKVFVDGEEMDLNEAIKTIQANLTSIRTDVCELKDLLDTAINGGGEVVSLDELKNLAGNYNTTLENWMGTALDLRDNDDYGVDHKTGQKKAGPTMADDDLTDIQEIVTGNNKSEDINISELKNKITPEAVQELADRLQGIRDQLQKTVDAIDSMMYFYSNLWGIYNYDTVITNARNSIDEYDIPLKNGELNTFAKETFNKYFQPDGSSNAEGLDETGDVLKPYDLSNSKYNPLINPETGYVDTPELYKYFYNQFGEITEEEEAKIDKHSEEGKKGKEAIETQQEEFKKKGRYHGPADHDIEKTYSTGDGYDPGVGALGGIVGLILDLVSGNFDKIRDNLYATTYVMNMFSYATYETEGLYNLMKPDDQKELTLPASGYKPDAYSSYYGTAESEGGWLSTNPKDGYNKTLTNKMINEANNRAYLAEVEYILYGGSNEDNVKKQYATLYALRLPLNTVSAFANFWSRKTTTGEAVNIAADAVALISQGIIPAPVTKCIILPLLAVYETKIDMDRLDAGFPVEIYKVKDEAWWVSIPKLNSVGEVMDKLAEGDFKKKNAGEGLFYSDYLTLFVYLGFQGSSSGEQMYKRVGEVMQANMRIYTSDDTYSMEKAQVYFQMSADLRVKPLMMTLPFFEEYNVDTESSNGWNSFGLKMYRGYP